ncbi:MAG: sigma-54 dependent transcriptional regulator [Myxococcota bacterium]|jgi:two-component system response regulator HydG|nr:sigma-54 dependent transcriptional regulator [Myxococcota bacterium]
MANILIVEDNETLREGIAIVVKRMGHTPYMCASGAAALEVFSRRSIDFTISDLKMEGMDGLQVLRAIRREDPEALVMIITAHGSIEVAVEAMKEGAFDFITKPFPQDVLRLKLEKALSVRLQRERLQQENEYLRNDAAVPKFEDIIGQSASMLRTFDLVRKLAPADSTVHIFGESGTGKELIAQALHELSPRRNKAFVRVNCGALAESLLESELFGHEKGAFTGAHKRRLGRFEVAEGGTLLLDEIADISAGMQVKLLRVLQEREFERVGGSSTVKVDVRVISATRKDLRAEVEAGRFREDLYYRLHIIPIVIPPLRERRDDIPLLARHFIKKLAARTRSGVQDLSSDALSALSCYHWPGNVRELENAIEQAMIFADDDKIRAEHLPSHLRAASPSEVLDVPEDGRSLPEILDDLERQLILRAFRKAKGVKTETARLLGVKTSALYYKLDKYGIDESVLAP